MFWKSSNSQFHSKKITTIFSIITKGNIIKINSKQNFVRRKIAVWAFGTNFKLDKIVWIKIIYIQKRVLFFLYKKVLRKAGL